jgi:methionyl-tRNA formyltransferase
LLVETLAGLEGDNLEATPQPQSGITHAPKLEKAEGSVDFAAPAQRVHDRIRGLDPWPAVTVLLEDERLKISSSRLTDGVGCPGEILALGPEGMTVACADGAVCIRQVQGAGGRAMAPQDFARGSRLRVGQRLRPVDGFQPLGLQAP